MPRTPVALEREIRRITHAGNQLPPDSGIVYVTEAFASRYGYIPTIAGLPVLITSPDSDLFVRHASIQTDDPNFALLGYGGKWYSLRW